jgi:endonuclease YncB( thermonuclease family)
MTIDQDLIDHTPEELFSFKCVDIIPCRICHIYDGDTVHAVIRHKGDIVRIACRLYGIDTPEIIGDSHQSAMIARNRLVQLMTDKDIDLHNSLGSRTSEFHHMVEQNKKIIKVQLLGRDKYGRELAIFHDDTLGNINSILLQEGLAKEYALNGKKPF